MAVSNEKTMTCVFTRSGTDYLLNMDATTVPFPTIIDVTAVGGRIPDDPIVVADFNESLTREDWKTIRREML